MKKSELKPIILQLNSFYNPIKDGWKEQNWHPVAILANPADLDVLIAYWERKFRAEKKQNLRLNEFSIGHRRFKIVYAREWTS